MNYTPRTKSGGNLSRRKSLVLGIVNLFVALAILSAALSACTGTTQPDVPTLLVVGYTDSSGSHVALIEDRGLDAPSGADRFAFLSTSVRLLPAPPVAYDVVDRGRGRTELVVLSREDTGGATPIPSFLSFFNIEGIELGNPVDFELTPTRSNNPIPLQDISDPTDIVTSDFCPVDVQVSADGTYVALTSDPSECGQSTPESIVVVNSSDLTLDGLDSNFPVLPGGTYLDQANDRLYYSVLEVTNASILWEPIADVDVGPTPPEIADIPLNGADLRDIGPVGASSEQTNTESELVVLLSDSFVPIFDFRLAPDPGDPISVSGGQELLLDDSIAAPNVMILNSNFAVFENVVDDEADTENIDVIDGVVDELRGFVYFVDDGNLCIFDLQGYVPEQDLGVGCGFPVSELVDPAFITWTRAALDAPAP